MPTLRIALPTLLLVLMSVLLTGCHSIGALAVEVRDIATQEPVADATVIARATSFYRPEHPFDAINERSDTSAVTDRHGVARLPAATSCPGHLIVLARGHVVQSVRFDEHPRDTGAASEWLRMETEGDLEVVAPTLELRLLPASN